MTVTRTIVERCGVQISRVDSGRRVVYGEVMLPAPVLVDGQRVAAAELEGRIHFDGGHMVAEDIVRLLDAFAVERCPVDVMHDKTPRGATVVESFRAYEGNAPWTSGAWVVGVKIHEDAVWERIDSGELKAFSIQFVVNVTRLGVIVVADDGTETQVELYRFSEPRPQFLSLVDKPATGANWKIKERSVRPLAGAVVDRTWDAAAARERVEAWAKADDHRRVADAFLTYDGTGGGHLVADVEDGRLVVVRQAMADVPRDGLDDDDAARLAGLLSVHRAVVPFQDLPLADLETQWDAGKARARVKDWAGGDDFDSAKFRKAFTWYDADEPDLLGSYKLGVGDIVDGSLKAVPRAVFAAAGRLDQTDIPDDDVPKVQAHLGKYYDKMDRIPPWEEERSMGDDTKPEDVERDSLAEETPAEDVAPEPEVAPEAEPVEDKAEEPAAEPEAAPEEAPAEDVVEPEPEPVVEDTTETPEPEAAPEPTPVLYTVVDGVPTVAPDDHEGPTYTMGPDGAFALVEVEAPVEDPEVQRGSFADIMAEMLAEREISDMLWMGTSTLHDMFWRIMDSEDVPAQDKIPAMQQAVADFGTWAITKLGEHGVASFAPQDSPLSFSLSEHVERAGKKMAKARLKKLKTAVETLAALIAELEDQDDDDVKRSVPEPTALEAKIDALTEAFQSQTVVRARPAPSHVGGDQPPATQSNEAIVADLLRGK